MFLIGLVIQAAILAGAVYVVARHEADFDFWKLVMVAFGISFLNFLVSWGLSSLMANDEGEIPLLLYLPLWLICATGISAFLIQKFLYLLWRDALIASVVYLVANIIWRLTLNGLLGR